MRGGCRDLGTSYNPRGCNTPTTALIMGAALGLGLTVARRPWPLITGATFVLGLAVATNSVSRPLFA